ncbi:hypothetical protein PsorP6_017436 [Peronosclerospora sorghi]|uniref:Uncharacterized protein n=1 Tax=Peronosclerospora sorghi TaxID=230839 RepID=A0ACC0WP38_9STRA|nr:hypothetical protein PsorP6_017436 [Peronosclerospora sorghi]
MTLKARIHAAEKEMVAGKAENLRLVFQVAQTVDSAAKLKQDYEAQLLTRREKRNLAPLDVAMEGVASDSYYSVGSRRWQCKEKSFAASFVAFKRLRGRKKDVLETRLTDLHAVANQKVGTDEWQKKDREVEEFRSSLVQAKVNFLDQKQQLTALEKKLVDVSKSKSSSCAVSNASLDAERREYEAALIEMIGMEKKLQVAYEAKQGLESTLKERLEAKADLEERLSVAEYKIAELKQQLEQNIALIATIEEQLKSVDQERDRLADNLVKTKSKLERSRGKLEEKVIEFKAFKTTTNMLKDERSRLFNEIALLEDKIEKSEELANEELNDQLNDLADKIAELEAEKQELGARLEETVYRSEEDIHQLRERLYMLEVERSSMEEENQSLEKTMERLEDQKAHLEAASRYS